MIATCARTRESRSGRPSSGVHIARIDLGQYHPILSGFPTGSRYIDTLATAHMARCHLCRIFLGRRFDQLRTRGRMRVVAAMNIEGLPHGAAHRFLVCFENTVPPRVPPERRPACTVRKCGPDGADLNQYLASGNAADPRELIEASLDGPLAPSVRARRCGLRASIAPGVPLVSMRHQQGDRHGIQQRAGGAAHQRLGNARMAISACDHHFGAAVRDIRK